MKTMLAAVTRLMPGNLLRGLQAAAVTLLIGTGAMAQSYPVKPIRWLVPSGPGGAHDIVARGLVPAMSTYLGQVLVLDNQPAASGTLSHELTARAAPDGYTIVTSSSTQLVLNPFMQAKIPYNALKDFAPVGQIGDLNMALFVLASTEVRTLQGLIDYSKANPGKLNYGSGGIGHSFHLTAEVLKQRTGADLTHIPYKGTNDMLKDFLAGRIEVVFYPPSGAMISQMKAGTIRALATGASKRLSYLPDLPTFDEQGVPNPTVQGWSGIVAPAGTPRPIIDRLNQALQQAQGSPEAMKAYQAMAMIPVASSPEQMADRINHDYKFWGATIQKLGIKPE